MCLTHRFEPFKQLRHIFFVCLIIEGAKITLWRTFSALEFIIKVNMVLSGVIKCSRQQLNLDVTLTCGQAFRWKKHHSEWISTFAGRVWCLRQDDDGNLHYRVLNVNNGLCSPNIDNSRVVPRSRKRKRVENLPNSENEEFLRDYFQLEVDLEDLYTDWCNVDPTFKATANYLPGIRVLRQEPLEALMAFICSSNNNITRISSMVEKLCTMYGTKLLDGKEGSFYAFPTVADCVCLMALDKTEAVPIDVHVWRMATRHYLPHLRSLKNLSAAAYKEIGDHFRKRFGPYAGWAQSVLFTSDLKKHTKSSPSESGNLEEGAT
ncbi:N-glycosylase/DNA lyase isoform X2 [Rhipicephalus sanguineus]|uniref:N-glycosylase/DNA lyase isoform X2 n=1 Tax=Rhipicephalus sanguineus TaxID=34632 RepID=UPI001895FDA8|nr:N-glycosylase/DNA lyase isoform X2 [Rhipicephalus sanguineus]